MSALMIAVVLSPEMTPLNLIAGAKGFVLLDDVVELVFVVELVLVSGDIEDISPPGCARAVLLDGCRRWHYPKWAVDIYPRPICD
jgi:hypothetical protein